MTDTQTLASGETELPITNDIQVETVESDKTYTQTEVDNMMARMKGSLSKKLLKPYEELGDPDELRQLKAEAEKKSQQEAINRVNEGVGSIYTKEDVTNLINQIEETKVETTDEPQGRPLQGSSTGSS